MRQCRHACNVRLDDVVGDRDCDGYANVSLQNARADWFEDARGANRGFGHEAVTQHSRSVQFSSEHVVPPSTAKTTSIEELIARVLSGPANHSVSQAAVCSAQQLRQERWSNEKSAERIGVSSGCKPRFEGDSGSGRLLPSRDVDDVAFGVY
jgi:hypothetical protein